MLKRKEPEFKFNLGDTAKDKITGFEGIIYNRSQWLYNCNTYGLKPTKLDKDGETRKTESFDEPQLELVEKEVFEPKRDTGGPCEEVKPTNRL